MGGLARSVSYIKAFRYRSSGEVPTLFVDAGNLFSDEHYSGSHLPESILIKNKWVLKSYDKFGHNAANLSHYDLAFAAELFKKEGFEQRTREYPFIKKLISANIHPASSALESPVPYSITEITLKRGKPGQRIRIGIVGFTELKPLGATDSVNEFAGFKIENPFEAAKRVIPELKQKVDMIIALVYMPQVDAQKLAGENPEIDTVIAARQTNGLTELQHFNTTTVTYAYNQTKYLGELRYYVKSDGSIENRVNRFVALDEAVPDEPSAAEVVSTAHNEFTGEQNKAAAQSSATVSKTGLLTNTNSPYIGGQACVDCHAEQHKIWEKSGHAHAMATLEARNQQFDTACVKCHVVGYESGGFQALYSTPQFANVQCESCHGPGRAHAASPAKGYGFMATPTGCVVCHTKVNSPDFNFATYWPRIKH